MTDILLSYYGVDWTAMVMTFFSLYYLGEKRRAGFVFGVLASISWLTFGVLAGSIANVIANVIFITLNIRGYINWQKTITQ
jgi:hypothetical protein